MSFDELREAAEARISEIPVIDVHTHLVGGRLGARGLHDIMLYHMAVSDLYAAGCPSGSRLTQYPGWPTEEEAHARIIEAIPYLKYVQQTWISHGIKIILKDLYGFEGQITQDNWQNLDSLIRERADDKAWQREILQRARIELIGTEYARRENFTDGDILNYSLEWAFFTRCQWGEFDTALYELERCWGKTPESPTPIGSGARPQPEKTIRTVDDIHAAIRWYIEAMPVDNIRSMATHISTDIDFRPVTDREMESALAKRDSAGPFERDAYASYINEAFLSALEEAYGGRIVFQFSFGAEPLPYETSSRLSQRTISQLAGMISRHPKLRFQGFVSSRHANQSMCTLCRELPNLSLAGYWWHNFFPSTMRQVMEERLEMLPTNKQVGFFSDAYCIEWAYAKSVMVKKELASVLADKVKRGHFDLETGIEAVRTTMYETPQTLLGMTPPK